MRLSNTQLENVSADISRPVYDRGKLRQHTVHIGVGAFHRAHQALYLDDLLGMENEPRWGECGLGVLPGDARMRDALLPQNCLYTLVEKGAQAKPPRIIGSMTNYLLAPEDPEVAIEKLAAEETKIVSLTVTEGGYFLNESTHQFTPEHPEIQHDLHHPERPITSIGLITAALDRRFRRGLPPFTLMSCDNLQGNGDVLREVVLTFAGMRDSALEQWLRTHGAFPNSMVDRITPATTPDDVATFEATYGFSDAWPVMTESFKQWVIEDHFPVGRPRWEKVGAEIVGDVAPYELMKMRLLNGSHLAMAYLGALKGYTYVHETMQDPDFLAFIAAFMEEVTPVVPPIPGTSVVAYKQTLLERFQNPGIRDQMTRICSEGSAKMPKWVLPSIVELLEAGRPINLLSLVIASWIFYLKQGVDERGRPLEIVDAQASRLRAISQNAATDLRSTLVASEVFGPTLSSSEPFLRKVALALAALGRNDVVSCMRQYLAGGAAGA